MAAVCQQKVKRDNRDISRKGVNIMSNYFRITAYQKELNVCLIADCNGRFEKLWQFSSFFVTKGFEIISVCKDEEFTCSNIPKADYDSEHILLRACNVGKPNVTKSFIEIRGKSYQPQLSP